jgi:hypothetical protein
MYSCNTFKYLVKESTKRAGDAQSRTMHTKDSEMRSGERTRERPSIREEENEGDSLYKLRRVVSSKSSESSSRMSM